VGFFSVSLVDENVWVVRLVVCLVASSYCLEASQALERLCCDDREI
jgi:hypothetical protein